MSGRRPSALMANSRLTKGVGDDISVIRKPFAEAAA